MRRIAAAVGMVAALAAGLGIGVESLPGQDAAVDETEYLLSALSLAEDGDLDISDELAERRWRSFRDVEPPTQTMALPDGRRISPHDPLLPVLLAAPMGWAGWVAAKAVLALLAGALAALAVWVAVRRLGVPPRLAGIGVALGSASAPLAVYGQQVYPELPAALAVLLAVAALTGPTTRGALGLVVASVTALPWLSVKYVPVAVVVAILAAVRWRRAGLRRHAAAAGGALAVLALGYLAVHRAVWGGWTVYASGDHFAQSGELSVVGAQPDYLGRSVRLVALLVDRGFGLVPWQPVWVLTVPALAALAAQRRRIAGVATLVAPLLPGVFTATFLALTMHGYWWPGRQLVVVLPVAGLVVLRWLATAARWVRVVALLLGLAGVANYMALLAGGYAGELTWVAGFESVPSPLYQLVRPVFPDYRGDGWVLHILWAAALGALAVVGWRAARKAAVGAPLIARPRALAVGAAYQQAGHVGGDRRATTEEDDMTTTPGDPLRDDDMTTMGGGSITGPDADTVDADADSTDSTDADGTDSTDADATDA